MPSKIIKFNCSYCDVEFERGKYDIERTIKRCGYVYCNNSCARKHKKEIKIKEGFSEFKTCTKCGEDKPRNLEVYPIHKKSIDGLDSWCRKCRATYRSEINRGRFRGQLLDEEVRELKKQKLCDICGKENSGGNKNCKHIGEIKGLVMDHNHNTGKFRGMLCHHCNRGLGNFYDNISNMEKAILYLKENPQ